MAWKAAVKGGKVKGGVKVPVKAPVKAPVKVVKGGKAMRQHEGSRKQPQAADSSGFP